MAMKIVALACDCLWKKKRFERKEAKSLGLDRHSQVLLHAIAVKKVFQARHLMKVEEVEEIKEKKMKVEDFMKKIYEMMVEEKQRIPIAQGLSWATDEPELIPLLSNIYKGLSHQLFNRVLLFFVWIKPHVKEYTIPVDLRLHGDV
ncbi:hypothetical protein PTKIN_Ptkin01aG0149800 [Pterospermum kingtungense]